jgi:amino acid adenylation domain-containing protein
LILDQVIENPSITIRNIAITEKKERNQIFCEFNKIQSQAVVSASIYQKMLSASIERPQGIAVKMNNTVLSFKKLVSQVDNCYRQLLATGCRKGDIIAVSAEPCPELVIGILAINRLGACILPLDLNLPVERLAYMLKDSSAQCLLTSISPEIKSPPLACKILQVSLDAPQITKEFFSFDVPEHAYIVYTSGTTGNPKGVAVKNESLCNYLQWFKETINITISDQTILLSSFAFDLCYTAVYSAFWNAHTIHLLRREEYLNPVFLMNYLTNENITYIKLTPSHFAYMVPEQEHFAGTQLRWVILGGEKLLIADAAAVSKVNPSIRFMNHYGPTETTIGTIYEIIDMQNTAQYSNHVIIGRPIQNNQVFILDKHLKLMPVGLKGEICVAGKGVAAGYLNAPQLTASKFVQCADLNDKLVYRTGDTGKWLPDGRLEFLGRADTQIKLNGYRIETEEIERALVKHGQVTRCVVVCRTVHTRNVLVAYFVAHNKLDVSLLKTTLEEHLPFFMVPAIYCQLNELPITANGKIDTASLPLPAPTAGILHTLTVKEKELAGIWSSVLRMPVAEITSNDLNFFELGGNSILAVQLLNTLNQQFNKTIRFKDLYRNGSLKQLAQLLNESKDKVTGLTRVDRGIAHTASEAQKRLYLENTFSPQSLDYNKLYVVKLLRKISFEDTAKYFTVLLSRHTALKTTFHVSGTDIVQKISTESVLDISSETIAVSSLDQYIYSFSRPFKLSELPLIRMKYLQLSDGSVVLLLDTHHITSDGLSMVILLREFIEQADGKTLKTNEFDNIDFTSWLSTSYQAEQEAQQNKFWQAAFETPVRALHIPFKYRQNKPSNITRFAAIQLSGDLYEKINAFTQQHKITHYSFFLGCISILLGKVCQTTDILIGLMLDGRNFPDIKDMVGMFVNTLPFRIITTHHTTGEEVLKETNDKLLDYYEMQNYSLQQINQAYRNRFGTSLTDKLNILFEFNNYSLLLTGFKDQLILEETSYGHSRFEMIIRVSMNSDSFTVQIKYAESSYQQDNINTFLLQYRQTIEDVFSGKLEKAVMESTVPSSTEFDFSFDI